MKLAWVSSVPELVRVPLAYTYSTVIAAKDVSFRLPIMGRHLFKFIYAILAPI
jgi:hypothetical protein